MIDQLARHRAFLLKQGRYFESFSPKCFMRAAEHKEACLKNSLHIWSLRISVTNFHYRKRTASNAVVQRLPLGRCNRRKTVTTSISMAWSTPKLSPKLKLLVVQGWLIQLLLSIWLPLLIHVKLPTVQLYIQHLSMNTDVVTCGLVIYQRVELCLWSL